MARKKKSSNGNFIHYAIMGAGFAAGAAIVSVAITAATIGANEAYKLLSSKASGGEALPGGGTNVEFPIY